MKKALDYLHTMKNANEQMGQEPISIYDAIRELEELQNTINTAIEEIEYAFENPDYAEFYLSIAKDVLWKFKGYQKFTISYNIKEKLWVVLKLVSK